MALSKKEYSEMMKYLTRPVASSAQLGARAETRAGFKEGTPDSKTNTEKTKMILDMLRRGADVDTISTITGATVEEINNIAMKAKPISTEESLSTNEPNPPEEQLSRNKTYSEIDILSNIDAKKPNSITKENITIYPMPELNPKTDNYMPEFYGMENPKDVARYRQVPLKEGGRPMDTPADVAVEKSLFNPKQYGKYAKKIATTPLARSAAKLTGAELALGIPFSVLDYEAGYTPKEILLNVGTLGFGTSIRDNLKMIKALGPKKSRLLQQYAAQGTKRRLDSRKGIESIMDKEMQKALNARDEFFEKLEEKRAKLGEQRLRKGELESERIGMRGEAEGD